MSNPAINWIKEHAGLAAGIAGAIGLLFYLMTRAGNNGGSALASVAQAQQANAALATQNAAVQANLQAQTNTAAYAAQVANNENAAALAATIAQYNAQTKVAELAAGVQNNTINAQHDVAITSTNRQADVATTLINAESAAQATQVKAESDVLQHQIDYMIQANNNQTEIANQIIPGAVKNLDNASNISANATNILDTILGNSNSAIAASNAEAVKQSSSAASRASIFNGLFAGVSNVFASLFS
jgi:hypothetical protein